MSGKGGRMSKEERFQEFLDNLFEAIQVVGEKHGFVLLAIQPWRKLVAGRGNSFAIVAGDMKAGGVSGVLTPFNFDVSDGNVESYNKCLNHLVKEGE